MLSCKLNRRRRLQKALLCKLISYFIFNKKYTILIISQDSNLTISSKLSPMSVFYLFLCKIFSQEVLISNSIELWTWICPMLW